MGQLVHNEDIYALDTSLIKNFDDILVKLDEDGYKMGKLSLMSLIHGEVEQACGFSYEEDQTEYLLSSEVNSSRLMESISQLKYGQIILTGTPNSSNYFYEQFIKENPMKPKHKVSISRNKREGLYCGYKKFIINVKGDNRHRRGNCGLFLPLKEYKMWYKTLESICSYAK